MAPKDQKDKVFAKAVMQQYGIALADIPTKDAQTPDFEFILGADRYTVELKTKGDDPDETAKFMEEFEKGGIVKESTEIEPRSRLAAIVKEGLGQIASHDPSRASYWLIWLHCAGRQPEVHWEKSQSTILGSETLISLNKKHLLRCYYFRNSTFFRLKNELDAVILTKFVSGQCTFLICVNTYSPRYEQFKNSELFRKIPARAVCDPLEEEKTGGIIADCQIDRKDENAILSYLQTKYQLEHLQIMKMNYLSGTMKLPE